MVIATLIIEWDLYWLSWVRLGYGPVVHYPWFFAEVVSHYGDAIKVVYPCIPRSRRIMKTTHEIWWINKYYKWLVRRQTTCILSWVREIHQSQQRLTIVNSTANVFGSPNPSHVLKLPSRIAFYQQTFIYIVSNAYHYTWASPRSNIH